MSTKPSLWQLLAILLVAVATAAFGQEQSLQTLRVVSLPGRPFPVVAAITHGTFAKHGLQVRVEVAPSSEKLRSSLKSGEADVAHIAVDNAVAMVESDGVDVVIVMGGETTLNELIAQPGIRSIKDLRGRTLIVDAPDTAFALQLKKMLLSSGLRSGQDYQIKSVGGSPLRLKGLRENKEYAAGILGPPLSIIARKEGFVSLGSAEKDGGPYQGHGAFARRAWVRDNADLLVRYLAAYVEGQRWLLSPSNKQQVIELISKETGIPALLAADMYAATIQHRDAFQTDAQLDVNSFKNVLKLRAEIEGQWGGRAPGVEKYYDPSFYRRALSRLQRSR